jgi:SnoaL-like domain
VPDIEARVLRSVEDGDTLWSEWEMTGTSTDGGDFRAGGVAILGVEDDRLAWARIYLDPVDDEPTDAYHFSADPGLPRGWGAVLSMAGC